MLKIRVKGGEYWNEVDERFVTLPDVTLVMEHSLISVSKWESETKKCFLDDKAQKTNAEMEFYFQCMCLNEVSLDVIHNLSVKDKKKIIDYIAEERIGFKFKKDEKKGDGRKGGDPLTSDFIYYYMLINEIPFTPCEKWHLSRLMALLRICAIKQQPPPKMSKRELAGSRSSLNAARRVALGSKG